MDLKTSIKNGVIGLGIAATAFGVVAADSVCMFDAQVVKTETSKICFSKTKDYDTFKEDRVNKYKADKTGMFLWSDEGQEFLGILQVEIDKKGNWQPDLSVENETDLIDSALEYTNLK